MFSLCSLCIIFIYSQYSLYNLTIFTSNSLYFLLVLSLYYLSLSIFSQSMFSIFSSLIASLNIPLAHSSHLQGIIKTVSKSKKTRAIYGSYVYAPSSPSHCQKYKENTVKCCFLYIVHTKRRLTRLSISMQLCRSCKCCLMPHSACLLVTSIVAALCWKIN